VAVSTSSTGRPTEPAAEHVDSSGGDTERAPLPPAEAAERALSPPADDCSAVSERDTPGDEGWASADFSDFFAVAYPEAFRLARRMGLGSHDAEDVAIEALTRAYVSWSRLQTVAWNRPWLTRVVANLTIDVHRRRRPPVVAAPGISFEGQTVAGMDLSRALAKLPRRQRQVVGIALRLRPGSVKQHASRAVRALRAHLGQMNREA
jgi:DNA-directed RNA polymerase specialized sigma24 family protein